METIVENKKAKMITAAEALRITNAISDIEKPKRARIEIGDHATYSLDFDWLRTKCFSNEISVILFKGDSQVGTFLVGRKTKVRRALIIENGKAIILNTTEFQLTIR